MTVATAYKRHSIRGVRLRGDIHFHGSERNAPESMKAIDVKMPKELAGMHFRMQVSAMDCTGCGNCADVCPAKEKALVMKPFESQLHEAANWDYAQKFLFTASLSDCHWQSFSYKDNLIDKKANVKNSQFSAEPTAYHGLGMATATRQMRDRVERIMKECAELSVNVLPCDCCSAEIKALFTEWIENRECTLKTKEIADKLIPLMEKCGSSFSVSLSETATGSFLHICKQLLELRHSLVKKSQWIFGRIQAPVKLGNSWGYDIGFGEMFTGHFAHRPRSGQRRGCLPKAANTAE